jgi:hypothetical protein
MEVEVLIAVLRESVSLFVLLVFLIFIYRLLDRMITLFDKFAENILDALHAIARKIDKKQN